MATTLNRTFYGGSTAPGSGVYPEDVKILKVFRNYAETDYDPLAGSDTSVYIPTVEKVDSSGTSINVTIQKILASGGYPILVYNNEEYQYITTGGTPSKYVFTCLSGLSTRKRVEVDVSNGTIVTSSSSVGGAVYPSLQSAIANADSLAVGDIFETNGFHTSGDSGAARYIVSNTGTANGMDIVQLATGKLAVLQAGDWIIPEQLGYEQSYSRNDVVPYIQRAIDIGCQHIHLISSGGKAGYTWKTKLTVSVRGFKLTGEGDWGSPNKFSYVVFRPNESVTEMLDLSKRDVLISDIDFEVTGSNIKLVDGITCSTYDMDETRFWEFRNLRFNSFRKCIYLGGTVKWQNTIKDCLFNYCVTGIEIYESSTMQLLIENCQFIGCESHDLLFNGNVLSAKMICCNFGSADNGVAFKVNSSTYLYQNASFESCNFENDNADGHNRRALAIDLYDPNHSGLRQNITISNCHFVIGKLSAPVQDTTNRFIRLGDSTHLVFLNNQILGHNEPEHSTWVTDPKLLWDETSLPVNGVIVCVGESVSLEFPDELLPYLQRYNETSRMSVSCRRNASEQGWGDCNTWLPDFDGQVKVCGVSTYDSPATRNLPITNTFGFLWVIGTIIGSNARVLQRYEAHNGNIYTRLGRGNNGVWTWDNWKTITNLPNGLLSFDSVADTNSSAIQVWGGDNTSGLGTYKSIGNVSVPAGHIVDITIAGSLQHSVQNNSANTIVFQASEQDSLDNDAIVQPVYIRGKGALEEIPLSIRFIVRNTSSATKTYYFGAYNLSSVPSGNIIELTNNLTNAQGLRMTLISYGVNS